MRAYRRHPSLHSLPCARQGSRPRTRRAQRRRSRRRRRGASERAPHPQGAGAPLGDAPEGSWSTLLVAFDREKRPRHSACKDKLRPPDGASVLLHSCLLKFPWSVPKAWGIPENSLASVHDKSSALLEHMRFNIEAQTRGLLLISAKRYPELPAGLGLTLAMSNRWSGHAPKELRSLV